jgi:hypothetical protein
MTEQEAFAKINEASGGTCFVDTEGPAIVQIATIRFPDGSTQTVEEYLAANPGVLA